MLNKMRMASVAAVAGSILLTGSLDARTVRISDFGFDPSNSTRFVQAALDSGGDRIVFDRRPEGPWFSDSVYGRSNCEIVFEPGAELVARRGGFTRRTDALLTFSQVSNVLVRGRGRLRMWKEDYRSDGGHRHTLSIRACRNVTIEDLECCESGGDGIYISTEPHAAPGFKTYCENVTIRNVRCLRNLRQGISVIAVDGLLIEGCELSDTSGSAPESGVDFEPNAPKDPLVNCVMRNCRFERNNGHGCEFMLVTLDETAPPVSVVIENCVSRDNRKTPFGYNGVAPNGNFRTAGGRVSVKDCRVRAKSGAEESYSHDLALSGTQEIPPIVGPQDWDRSKVRVVDLCPGEMVPLLPTRCRRNASYLLYAAKPGPVRVKARQIVVGKGTPTRVPLIVSRFRGDRIAELAAPSTEGSSYAIELPERGFYQLDWDRNGNEWGTTVMLTESDAPIAFSMFADRDTRGLWQSPFMWGQTDTKLLFAVPSGCKGFAAIACGFSGGVGQSVRAVVTDPTGTVVYDRDNVTPSDAYCSPANPAPGLWTIEAKPPSNGRMNNFGFDLAGIPPVFFLTEKKYWCEQ